MVPLLTAFRRTLCLACCCVVAWLPRGAFAQVADERSGLSWAVGLAGQVDEESNDSLLATLNLGVTDRTWLTFAAGRSSSPSDVANVSAETLAIGLDHRFGLVGLAFDVERWGDPDALETSDMRAAFYIQQQRFRVALSYGGRDIDIPFTLTGPLGGTQRRTAEVAADSLALNLRVQPAELWQLYIGMSEHDYERDLALLPRIAQLNLLSASTLTLANSFIDHERMIGFERVIKRSLVNVSFTRDESAVDGSIFETVNAGVLFPIAPRIDLEVNLGNGRSELLPSGLYGGVLLLIYGR